MAHIEHGANHRTLLLLVEPRDHHGGQILWRWRSPCEYGSYWFITMCLLFLSFYFYMRRCCFSAYGRSRPINPSRRLTISRLVHPLFDQTIRRFKNIGITHIEQSALLYDTLCFHWAQSLRWITVYLLWSSMFSNRATNRDWSTLSVQRARLGSTTRSGSLIDRSTD